MITVEVLGAEALAAWLASLAEGHRAGRPRAHRAEPAVLRERARRRPRHAFKEALLRHRRHRAGGKAP